MTIEEMKLRKQELGYSYEQIAELSGLPLSTVQKVLGGITRTPRYETIRALEEVLSPYSLQMPGEPIIPYGKQKKQRGSKHPLELFQLHFQLNLPDLAVLQRDFQQLK